MKKRFLALLMAMMCLCCSALAESAVPTIDWRAWLDEDVAEPVAEFFADGTTITTIGSVRPFRTTDIAVISFTLTAKEDTVAQANTLMMQSVQTLRDTMTTLGVAEENIRQMSYDVERDVLYHNTKLTQDQVVDGYLVSLVLEVRITDLTIVGKVIDSAMQIGASISHDLVYEYSAAAEAYDNALVEATQEAIAKAGLIAESLSLKLVNLVSIEELSTPADQEAVVQIVYLAK